MNTVPVRPWIDLFDPSMGLGPLIFHEGEILLHKLKGETDHVKIFRRYKDELWRKPTC
jgi:hypothetical protein